MCSNYEEAQVQIDLFPLIKAASQERRDVWPTQIGSIVTWDPEANSPRLEHARFGLLPAFADAITFGRRTYNAREETVATKPSFKHAWKVGHRCLVPVSRYYEPCYETGKAVRHAIWGAEDDIITIGGIWSWWPPGKELSFAMVTVNADGHEVMQRFHKPEDEKRMPVIIAEMDRVAWLTGSPEEGRALVQRYPTSQLASAPSPLRAA